MTTIQTSSIGVPGGLVLAALIAWAGTLSDQPVFRSPIAPSATPAESLGKNSLIRPSDDIGELEESETDRTLAQKVGLLKKGQAFLDSVDSYSAEFRKREVVDGELLDEQVILLKCRHQPFSVYLHWLAGEVGREVLYVEGLNEGRLLVHDGSWKARLPAVSLSPESTLAMSDTRYPVTMAGIQGLLKLMLDLHQQDLQDYRAASCEVHPEVDLGGRTCLVFTTNYASAEVSPTYRKSVTWIDEEWGIPVKSLHYEWPRSDAEPVANLDEVTLIESYEFSKFDFANPFTNGDFDRDNPEYRFR